MMAMVIAGVGCEKKQAKSIKPVELRMYAGAGLRRAVDQLATEFEAKTGVKVTPDYGGSGMIISRAQLDPAADLFMPGDVAYVDRLQEKAGLIASKTPIAYFVPVIITAKGNPKNVRGLEDFFRDDLLIALGNPKACQVGRLSDKIFAKNKLDRAKLAPKESVTVNELGVWVKTGDVDVAIVWDAIAANIADSVDVIEIPAENNLISRVVVGLMTTSQHKSQANAFIAFMASDAGRAILNRYGYRTEAP